jgi:MFS family permease
MLDLTLLRRGPLAGILVAAVLYSAAAFSALVYASIWLQTVLGLGPISAGLVTLPLSALAFSVAAGVGRLLHGMSPRLVLGAGLALVAIGDLLQIGLDGGSDWPRVLAGLAVVGVGVGAMSPVLASAAMAAVPHERGGMAAGAVNTARQLGLALGIAILGSVFSSRVADNLTDMPRGILPRRRDGERRRAARPRSCPAAARGQLDAAIHHAVGSALGTTFLVAGVAELVSSAVVLMLMRERRAASTVADAPSATPGSSDTARRVTAHPAG